MKKKYVFGAAGILVVLVAVILAFVLLGRNCTLTVPTGSNYTVSVKGVKLDENGKASLKKGDELIFAVTLDKDYSDSNIKVKANDTEVSAKDGVYRYTVEKDTVIGVDGVTENDHIVQGLDVDPGTLDGMEFTLLKDEDGRPVKVLKELNMNAVDTFDVPDLELMAYVSESINPGWKPRELSEVNLGKYQAAKFYVKNTNYLEARTQFADTDFWMDEGKSGEWHEFLFKNDDGVMNIYVDGKQVSYCNYLSDISLTLQDKGSYKFSNIYVVERDDYVGAELTVEEGDGYSIDLLSREYAVGAVLKFHVTISEDFEKSSSFAVMAGNQKLEPAEDGTYSFKLTGNTTLKVVGLVPKPLDSRYKALGMPMMVEASETTNYALMKTINGAKTYSFTQEVWGYVPFNNITLEQYSNLLFYVKKDDTAENTWISFVQKLDDGTETPYLQKNDNTWHKIEIKKESGKMYVYADGEKNETPIEGSDFLYFVLNDGLKMRFTSILGIVDNSYVPPAPEYISSAYKYIGSPAAIMGTETTNYELVSKIPGAKTFKYVAPDWGAFGFKDVDFNAYKQMVFFIHKDDLNLKNWLEFYKVNSKGEHAADYVQKNDNKWYKIELKKVANNKFDVYVNDKKHDVPVSNAEELGFTLNKNSTFIYTGLFGIADPHYVPEQPDYVSSAYSAIVPVAAVMGTETVNYAALAKVPGAKTYVYSPEQWGPFGFANIELQKYKDLVFFVHKEDMYPQNWLEFYKVNKNNEHVADYIQVNNNKWFKVELKKDTATGEFDVYVNGEKQNETVSNATELKFTLNANSVFYYTSLCGIVDPNYHEEIPDYLSSDYQTIGKPITADATEIACYNVVSKIDDAKTYEHTAGWVTYPFSKVDLDKYKNLVFYIQKTDFGSGYMELLGANDHPYMQRNDFGWYKIELKKRAGTQTFDIYVNGTKDSTLLTKWSDLKLRLYGTFQFTSLFGTIDPDYKEPEPDYLTNEYKPLAPAVANTSATEITNYELVSRVENAKTYEFTTEWNHYFFADAEVEKYKELAFYIRKSDTDGERWLQFYQLDRSGGQTASYIENNNNDWYKVQLKKTSGTKFDVYVNGEKKSGSVSDLSRLRFTLNGTFQFTSLFAVDDPNYQEPTEDYLSSDYKTVASATVAGTGAAEIDNYGPVSKTDDAKTYEFEAGWKEFAFAEVDEEKYTNLVFYMHKDDTNTERWMQFYQTVEGAGNVNYIQANDNAWYKVELKKNADSGKFDVYVNDVKKDGPVSDLTTLKFHLFGTIQFTSLFGIVDPDYQEPTRENKGVLVVTTPWAYSDGNMDNTKTYTKEGYEYANVIGGCINTYKGARMSDVDLSIYESFRFALKSTDGKWWEIGSVADNKWDLIIGNEAEWTEYEFKNTGEGYFQMYKNGESTSVVLAENLNLSDLQMKFAEGGTLYMTEVRGEVKDGAQSKLQVVAQNFNQYEGEVVKTELPNRLATGSTKVATSWDGIQHPLTDINLALYDKVIFYLRQAEGSGYLETNDFGTAQPKGCWTELKLVRNSDNTWNIYRSGVLTAENRAITNLNEITATYGTGTYLFSQVFAIPTANPEPEVEDVMVVTAPWAYYKGSMDNTQTYKEGGYEYATLIKGENVAFTGAMMKDVDMSIYSSFRFAVKTNGNYYYEVGKVADGNFGMFSGNETTWTEYTFEYENDGAGHEGFRVKKNGQWTKDLLPADMNLSDLQMKFSADENAILYMTELRGTLKDGAVLPMEVVADSFNGKTGTAVETEKPNNAATKSTEATTGWTATEEALTSVKLDKLDKVLFYARKAGSPDKTGWFESTLLGSFQIESNWTEFKLVRNADDTWNIYVGGVLKQSNKTLTNLSEVTAKYGENHYYFSEVFGVYKAGAEKPLKGEYMVVTSPWAYYKGSMDNTQTYKEGGYEYATLVKGENNAFEGAMLKDADMSIYSSFRFAVKTNGDYYYEVGKVADGNYGMFCGNETTWTEYTFEYEDDGAGNKGFRVKKNGQWTKDLLPADMNLSDLQMKFSTDENAILYMTEVRGTVKDGAELPLKVVADNFNDKTGIVVDTEKPNIAAKKATEVTTGWSATRTALASVKLDGYDKILFYARKAGSAEKTGWFESDLLGSFQIEYSWTEFKLVKNTDGTWNVYTGGKLSKANQTLANLSDITAGYGDNHYYFSEVFGIPGEQTPDTPKDPVTGEHVMAATTWSYSGGKADNSQTWTEKGYEKATLYNGGLNAYQGAKLANVSLAGYKEFRFAAKTNGNFWYEIGMVSDNTYNKVQKADTSWVEIKFVDEGNNCFQAFVNDGWVNWQLPSDANLSDIQMKFSSDEAGVLYLTEVRGILGSVK